MNKNLWLVSVILVIDVVYGASITRTRRTDEETPAVLEILAPEAPVVELKKQPAEEQLTVEEVKAPENLEIVGRNIDAPSVIAESPIVAPTDVQKPEEVQSSVPVLEKLLEIEEKSLAVEHPTEFVDALKLVSTEDKVEGVKNVVDNVKEALKSVPLSDAMKENAPIMENEIVPMVVAEEKKLEPSISEKEKLLEEEPKKEVLEKKEDVEKLMIEEVRKEILATEMEEIKSDMRNEKVVDPQPLPIEAKEMLEKEPELMKPEEEFKKEPEKKEEMLDKESSVKKGKLEELPKIVDEPKEKLAEPLSVIEPEVKLDEMPKDDLPKPQEALKELVLDSKDDTKPLVEPLPVQDEIEKRIDTDADNLEYVDTKKAQSEIMEPVKNELPMEIVPLKSEEKLLVVQEQKLLPVVEEVKPVDAPLVIEQPKAEIETLSEPKSLEQPAPVAPIVEEPIPIVQEPVRVEEPISVGTKNLAEKPHIKNEETNVEGKNLEPAIEELKPESDVKLVDPKLDIQLEEKPSEEKLPEIAEPVMKQSTTAPNLFQSAIQNTLNAIGLGQNSQPAADEPAAAAPAEAAATTTAAPRPNIIQQIQSGIQGFLGTNQAASASTSAPAPAADEPAPTTARPSGILASITSVVNRPAADGSPPGPLATFVSNLLGNQPASTVAPAEAP